MKPLVSVVIPVFRGGDFFAEAIESVLEQTYDNIEIIVVNDGSDDNGETRAIAERYKDKIRYFEKENGGVSTALNRGIKEMRGEYFSWLSHDDLYYPGKIEKQISFLERRPAKQPLVIYSDFDVVDERGVLKGAYRINTRYTSNPLIPVMFGFLNGCTMLIPAVCFDEAGLFDENLRATQDYELWFRLAKMYSFVHIPMTAVKSREHSLQSSKVDSGHSVEADRLYIEFIDRLTEGEIRQLGGDGFTDKLYLVLICMGYNDAARHLVQKTGHMPAFVTHHFYGRINTGWRNHYNFFSIVFDPVYFFQKVLLKIKIFWQRKQLVS